MTGLLVIPMLALVILIHELGHAAGAALCGIRVKELLLGFGPILKRWRWRDVLVTLRAAPVGGGLEIDDEDYERATLVRKRISLLAGPAASMMAGWLLCGTGKFIATMGKGGLSSRIIDAVVYANALAGLVIPETAEAFGGASVGNPTDLVGPVGFAGWMSALGPIDLPEWLVLVGAVSLGAGLFNLLPLPPLDGGRALVVAARPRLGAGRIERLEKLGVALLMALGVVVALGDLLRIVFAMGGGQ